MKKSRNHLKSPGTYSTNPPLPGDTAILPEYIHYYGYYYQVIVQYLSYVIYQGTDILPEIFSSSLYIRVFVATKLHEGASPRVILSDKHECWTARKNFWQYISVPRQIRKRIARKNFPR
jgi:hypothetical protein